MTTDPNNASIELFWRTANYISAAMLYLKDNVLLREELKPHHFKEEILGHWGTVPGVNAIYAHASDLSRRSHQRMRFILGTGHAGPAMLANLYLEGSLERHYPQYTRDISGLEKLFRSFAASNGFSTEISAQYPGMLYAGGELGAALAFTQGYALKNPKSFSICVLGDGELETSITQASWQGFKFLSASDGYVLPVINANGHKMGSRSLYSLKSREENESFYRGHGLLPIFVNGDHGQIAHTFDLAFSHLIRRHQQPVIIIESPKGWTAPKQFGRDAFEGSYRSHKPILRNPGNDPQEMKMIEDWLRSYKPEELFDVAGTPIKESLDCLPSSENLLGNGHYRPVRLVVNASKAAATAKTSVAAISNDISEGMSISKDLIVFSPDELTSNKMGTLLRGTKLKYGETHDPAYSPDGQVIEILNEHLCYAWAQGLSAAGGYAILTSYEAFAPLLDSMSAQHLKFLKGSASASWRLASPSMNIVLTSLGWHNCGTHHNPGYVDTLIGRDLENIHVYMPATPQAASYFFRKMMESEDKLNIIVVGKHELPTILAAVNESSQQEYGAWRVVSKSPSPDAQVSLIGVGDCMVEESLHAQEIIRSSYPGVRVQVVTIEDLNMLEYPNPEMDAFKACVRPSSACIWTYNGYPRTMRGLLSNQEIGSAYSVFGYKDRDNCESGLPRLIENESSRFHIAREAIRLLAKHETGIDIRNIEQRIPIIHNLNGKVM